MPASHRAATDSCCADGPVTPARLLGTDCARPDVIVAAHTWTTVVCTTASCAGYSLDCARQTGWVADQSWATNAPIGAPCIGSASSLGFSIQQADPNTADSANVRLLCMLSLHHPCFELSLHHRVRLRQGMRRTCDCRTSAGGLDSAGAVDDPAYTKASKHSRALTRTRRCNAVQAAACRVSSPQHFNRWQVGNSGNSTCNRLSLGRFGSNCEAYMLGQPDQPSSIVPFHAIIPVVCTPVGRHSLEQMQVASVSPQPLRQQLGSRRLRPPPPDAAV